METRFRDQCLLRQVIQTTWVRGGPADVTARRPKAVPGWGKREQYEGINSSRGRKIHPSRGNGNLRKVQFFKFHQLQWRMHRQKRRKEKQSQDVKGVNTDGDKESC